MTPMHENARGKIIKSKIKQLFYKSMSQISAKKHFWYITDKTMIPLKVKKIYNILISSQACIFKTKKSS